MALNGHDGYRVVLFARMAFETALPVLLNTILPSGLMGMKLAASGNVQTELSWFRAFLLILLEAPLPPGLNEYIFGIAVSALVYLLICIFTEKSTHTIKTT